MPVALIRMSTLEREQYVRWWVDKSGLTAEQLRKVAAGIWGDPAIQGSVRPTLPREEAHSPVVGR